MLRGSAPRFCSQNHIVGFKAPLDWPRPDDSILLLICVLGRFDNEIVRDVLEYFISQA